MKRINTLFFLFLLPFQAFTQQTAFFETTLYFEDAVGNRDTIVIGHDPDANGSFNPEFGEVDINVPWDSVFEVRASHGEDAFYYDNPIPLEDVFSKKIIEVAEGGIDTNHNCMPFKRGIILHVSQRYYPLKIYWNPTDFDNVCSVNSTITPHQNPLTAFEWWTDPNALADSACMADTSELIISTFPGPWIDFYAMDQIEGMGLGRVDGILLLFGNQNYPDTPCDKDIVNTEFLSESIRFSIFPNPTMGLVNLKSESTFTWQLFDITGKLLAIGNEATIDLADYPDGIYLLSATPLDGGPSVVEKVVKMNR